jgi:hypothetical protein
MDDGRHLSVAVMARLLMGQAEAEDIQATLTPHLVCLCPECQAHVAELQRLKDEAGHWDDVMVVTEWLDAPALWEPLAELSYAEQLRAVEADEDLQNWGICRLLQRRSAEAVGTDAAAAAGLASVAARVGAHLDAAYDKAWVNDLRALCLACLGNARRVLGELRGASDALDEADWHRAAGTGSPAIEADVLMALALLRRDEHRLESAAALFDRVFAIRDGFQNAEPVPFPNVTHTPNGAADPHLAGCARAHAAWCRYHLGQTGPAWEALADARSRVEEGRAPRVVAAVRLGSVWVALALGRPEEAAGFLGTAQHHAGAAGALANSRLRRAEAQLARLQGRRDAARRMLGDLPAHLLAQGLGAEAALAALDLIELELTAGPERAGSAPDGRSGETVRLASVGGAAARQAAALLSTFLSSTAGRVGIAALVRTLGNGEELDEPRLVMAGVELDAERRPRILEWSRPQGFATKEVAADAVPST